MFSFAGTAQEAGAGGRSEAVCILITLFLMCVCFTYFAIFSCCSNFLYNLNKYMNCYYRPPKLSLCLLSYRDGIH